MLKVQLLPKTLKVKTADAYVHLVMKMKSRYSSDQGYGGALV
jgi:hypothetical protein